jgi:hypothetical protein
MIFFEKLFLLLFAHCLSDYVFQNDFMARGKRRKFNKYWYIMLLAHSIINGGFVYLFIGNIYLGFLEIGIHFIIDFLKCEEKIDLQVDQTLHVISKIIYTIF